MAEKRNFDFCILGAGLAGVSVAKTLAGEDASLCLVDINNIASGASGTPLGLVNPCTGRYGTKTWRAEECYQAVLKNLREVQEKSPVQFFRKTGVLRPALKPKIATRMQENLESSDWPEGWIKWLSEQEIKERNPGLNCVEGGLWLPVGLTVDVSTYLKTAVDNLKQEGLHTQTGRSYKLKDNENHWEIHFQNGETFRCGNLVYAAGIDTGTAEAWEFLKLHPVKGQVAVFENDAPLSFDYAISALGYIASLSPTSFVAGSTYEHQFENRQPNEQGLKYLTDRMSKVVPELISTSNVIHQWAGVRASAPNRKPVAGKHPEYENVFVLSGLGSKGLLYSAYVAELLKRHIFSSAPLPSSISTKRFT